MTSIVKLQKKGQLTIPNQMRESFGLSEGDYIQVISRGNQIILEPAQVVTRTAAAELNAAQRQSLDDRLAKGMADVKAGRIKGPFPSAKDASAYIETVVKAGRGSKKPKRTPR